MATEQKKLSPAQKRQRALDAMTPEWRAYWTDPKAPHPDSFTYRNAPEPLGRAYAPFRGKEGESATTRMDQRETWYCHHYRLPGEHYHKTMEELEQCSE